MYFNFLSSFSLTAGDTGVNSRIKSFIAGYTKCIYLALGLSGIGFYIQFYHQLTDKLFVITTGSVVVLFLGQMLLSFYFILRNLWVALLGAFSSLAIAVGFMAVLFIFQDWWGWSILVVLAAPLAVITFLCLLVYTLNQIYRGGHRRQRQFLLLNLLVPFACLLFISLLAITFGKYQ